MTTKKRGASAKSAEELVPALPAAKVEPTERQAEQIEAMKARHAARPERPRSTVEAAEGGVLRVGNDVSQPVDLYTFAMSDALGSESPDFINHTMLEVTKSLGQDGATQSGLNSFLAVLAAIQPKDETEALLASQMIAAHASAHFCTDKMRNAQLVDQLQMYAGLANKFMRTFAAQMEALAKIRRGGEQIVKHVHVYEGGQAVVAGTIHQHRGGGGEAKDGGQSEAAIEAGRIGGGAALPSPDPSRDGMPLPCHAERPLQDARRHQPRRARG